MRELAGLTGGKQYYLCLYFHQTPKHNINISQYQNKHSVSNQRLPAAVRGMRAKSSLPPLLYSRGGFLSSYLRVRGGLDVYRRLHEKAENASGLTLDKLCPGTL